MYSIAHFFARRRTPGKNKTIIAILQFYPQSHSEYYAPCWGKFFSLLFFVFSLTCYRVFFFFSLSSISLITLLCYVLYVNFVIVCYLAFFYQFTCLLV